MHPAVVLRLKKAQKSFADFVSRTELHGLNSVIGGMPLPHPERPGSGENHCWADKRGMTEERKQFIVSLPVGLAREIEAIAGRRKRRAFFTEAAEREVRRRLLAAAKLEEIQMREAAEERILIN
jgi:hypothetical protein